LVCAADLGALIALLGGRGCNGDTMASALEFGRKLNVPSVIQIKHQLLVLWLKDQTAKEHAEASACHAKFLTPGSFATNLNTDRP
jgi:hypothetical protein